MCNVNYVVAGAGWIYAKGEQPKVESIQLVNCTATETKESAEVQVNLDLGSDDIDVALVVRVVPFNEPQLLYWEGLVPGELLEDGYSHSRMVQVLKRQLIDYLTRHFSIRPNEIKEVADDR